MLSGVFSALGAATLDQHPLTHTGNAPERTWTSCPPLAVPLRNRMEKPTWPGHNMHKLVHTQGLASTKVCYSSIRVLSRIHLFILH